MKIVIRNGRVIDRSMGRSHRIYVAAGKVAAIGEAPANRARTAR
jgi:dihydroorotase-like cyclic amidohydrolase